MRVSPSEPELEGANELLKLMGHVIATWQGVEHGVFDVYRSFFAKDHGDVAAVTFFAVPAFGARLRITDALVSEFASANYKEAWEKLSSRIRKKAKIRNDVAHGLFCFVGRPPNRKAMLGPSVYDVSKFPEVPSDNKFRSLKELTDAAVGYANLTKDIYEFKNSVATDPLMNQTLRKKQRLDGNDEKYPLTLHIPDGVASKT